MLELEKASSVKVKETETLEAWSLTMFFSLITALAVRDHNTAPRIVNSCTKYICNKICMSWGSPISTDD